MLSVVFCCFSDLFLGCPFFMRPKSFLSSICSFSISSITLSSLCILLKICNGPLSLIKSTELILESLKL